MAMLHWNTTNESALQIHYLLKQIGIENNTTHLTLLDESLVFVDPLREDLPAEIQKKVIAEIIRNPWYYYREIARVPTEDGFKTRFRFDIGSYASIKLKFLGFNLYVEKPRQTGKTVEALTTGGLSFNILSKNSSLGLYHFSDDKVKENMQEMLLYLETLPKYLKIWKTNVVEKDGVMVAKEISENATATKTVLNKVRGNKTSARTGGNTDATAEKAGRGAKQKEQIWDEVGHLEYIDVSLDAAIPAFGTASENAKAGGQLYYLHLLSTPPNVAKPHGKYLYKLIKQESLKFEPYMLDLSKQEIQDLLSRCKNPMIYITFQYNELGFSEEWAMKNFGSMTREKFRRDILLHWIVDFSNSPFDKYDIETLQDMSKRKKYITERVLQYYQVKWYEYKGFKPEETKRFFKNRHIILGVDTAAGLGGERDNSAIVGSCPETGATICTFKSNLISTKELSDLIIYMCDNYFDMPLFVIERNGVGTGPIDNLRGTRYGKYMYYTEMSIDMISRGQKPHVGDKYVYGIWNKAKIRPILYDEMLMDIVRTKKSMIDIEDMVTEIAALIVRNNQINHDKDGHDDLTMAKMISLFPLLKDRFITERYGIKRVIFIDDALKDMSELKETVAVKEIPIPEPDFLTVGDVITHMKYDSGAMGDDGVINTTINKGPSIHNWYQTDSDDDDPYR